MSVKFVTVTAGNITSRRRINAQLIEESKLSIFQALLARLRAGEDVVPYPTDSGAIEIRLGLPGWLKSKVAGVVSGEFERNYFMLSQGGQPVCLGLALDDVDSDTDDDHLSASRIALPLIVASLPQDAPLPDLTGSAADLAVDRPVVAVTQISALAGDQTAQTDAEEECVRYFGIAMVRDKLVVDGNAIERMFDRVRRHKYDLQYSNLTGAEHDQKQAELTEQFWTDLLQATGLTNHSKRHLIRKLAGTNTHAMSQGIVVGIVEQVARVLAG